MGLFKKVDAVIVKVPDIDSGLDYYCNKLGHQLKWRQEDSAAVELGESELVLCTNLNAETDMLVESVVDAVALVKQSGGTVIVEPQDISVGKVAVVEDPFGNVLTLVDLAKGVYLTDESRNVIGVGEPKK